MVKKFVNIIMMVASLSWMIIGISYLLGSFTERGITDSEHMIGSMYIIGGILLLGIYELADRLQELILKFNK